MGAAGKFYLGRLFDPAQGKTTDQPLEYEPADLSTHAVVVGMTGSGKTGLCIDLIEEAALQGIPALMIDPKGDIANCLLHFPDLLPQDFQPWVNPDQARREGKSIEQAAQEYAAQWKEGLAAWGIPQERLRALKNAAQFAVFTPGSDAGIPVNILASLKAPAIPWESNRELLREKISGTVTALLGLVGLEDIDPVRSREHILLANIFENAWSQGKDLELGELILQTQNPPFARLGVFDINTFFPEKSRFELAMRLNNILAAPAFQTWIEGQPLDIAQLLYTPDHRPRHSVFYIAHLSDAERMFFVTLLFSAVESWMRSQVGVTGLRAILYFDEIFGYLPPIGNPPSKPLMLRMLKQARAFGVGQIYATQNPVDMDYKALSNAGSWFIGKLQTERDKSRLLEGLDSASAGGLDRAEYDRLISSLGKRVFLLHNIHQKQPELFQTRWAMNFLAGPLTRAQIPLLNQLAGAAPTAPTRAILEQPSLPITTIEEPLPLDRFQAIPIMPLAEESESRLVEPAAPRVAEFSATRPAPPAGVREYFLPNNRTLAQALRDRYPQYPAEAMIRETIYRPVILGQASVRYLNRKLNLDYELHKAVLVPQPDRRGAVRWEQFITAPMDIRNLDAAPLPQARFAALEAPFSDARIMNGLQKDFLDWVYRTSQVIVRAHEGFKLYAGPEVSQAQFRQMVTEAAREGRDAELNKTALAYERRLDVLRDRIKREERELKEDRTELSQRRLEEMGTHAENLLGIFSKRSRRRLSTSLAKRRMTEQARAEVKESKDAIADYRKQIAALELERDSLLEQINERWGKLANEITEFTVAPYRKDILLEVFGVAWMPYYIVKTNQETVELAGFSAEGR